MSSNIDQDFVEYVVKSLVGNPDAVVIDRRVDEKGVLLELTVDPEDLGRIIGKRGATAQSLRTLLRALGTKNDARYNLKIVDNGPEDHQRPRRDEPAQQPNDDSSNSSSAADDTTVSDDSNDNSSVDEVTEDQDVAAADEQQDAAGDDVTDLEEEVDTSSDRAKRHRQDLEDLDDLDI